MGTIELPPSACQGQTLEPSRSWLCEWTHSAMGRCLMLPSQSLCQLIQEWTSGPSLSNHTIVPG